MSPITHCLPTGTFSSPYQLAVPNIGAHNCIIDNPTGLRRGRILLLHGLGYDYTMWTQSPESSFVSAMLADGWQCILCTSPDDAYYWTTPFGQVAVVDDLGNDPAHGARYLTTYLHTVDHIIEFACQQTPGSSTWPTVVNGISMGGWGSLQYAVASQARLVGYMAHIPAQALSGINVLAGPPFPSVTTGADLTTTSLNAVKVPGRVSYGTEDPIVGDSITVPMISNAQAAGMPVTGQAYAQSHLYNSTNAADQETYVTNTLDPLAPRVL